MQYRNFGRSGWNVSEIGFGAWGIGGGIWKGGSDEEAIKALHQAFDQGLNFIDTALAYGQGHSERMIRRFLSEKPAGTIYVATKIPPKNREWPARKGVPIYEVFPSHHIMASTEQSLKNLGVERLDLQQLHVWDSHWTEDRTWYETLLKLQQEGKIARFGISINDHDPDSALEVVERGWVDSVQVIYNIFDPTPATKLLPLCREKNIAVIARCPFDEGALTGAVTEATCFEEGDFRNDYFMEDRKKAVSARIRELTSLLRPTSPRTLPELALGFCLAQPDISTVIPGMRTVAHVNQNLAVSDGAKLPQSVLDQLAAYAWTRNFY